MFYKALELMVSENVQNAVLSLMVDRAFKLNVGRQGFGSVNPEIRIIEGRISEGLLYYRALIIFNFVAYITKAWEALKTVELHVSLFLSPPM